MYIIVLYLKMDATLNTENSINIFVISTKINVEHDSIDISAIHRSERNYNKKQNARFQ